MKKEPFSCITSVIWEREIQKLFNSIVKGRYGCLDHFGVNLILSNNRTVTICSNTNYVLSYKQMNMFPYSTGLYPELVDKLPVIPWRLLVNDKDHYRLNKYISFKEVLHGLYSGMCFIYKVGDVHFNIAVASYSKDIKHSLTFLNNAEDILGLGAYFFERFKSKLESLYHIYLPTIEDIVLTDESFYKMDRMAADWRDNGFFIDRF